MDPREPWQARKRMTLEGVVAHAINHRIRQAGLDRQGFALDVQAELDQFLSDADREHSPKPNY